MAAKRKVREPRTRSELCAIVERKLRLDVGAGRLAVDAVFDQIVEDLEEGRDVKLAKFGTFKSVILKGGTKRNPYDGTTVNIGERQSVRFKPSPRLKRAVPDDKRRLRKASSKSDNEAMA